MRIGMIIDTGNGWLFVMNGPFRKGGNGGRERGGERGPSEQPTADVRKNSE